MDVTQLRMERPLHRMCGAVAGGRRAPRSRPSARAGSALERVTAELLWLVVGIVLIATVVLAFVLSGSALLLLGVAVLVVVVALVWALGVAWWAGGAGRPVLQVGDGMVRGRIRPVLRHELTSGMSGWWDFELPTDAVQARLTDAPARRRAVVLQVPDDVAQRLLDDPGSARIAQSWRARWGSPAAWPAGSMLRRAGLDRRLQDLANAVAPLR